MGDSDAFHESQRLAKSDRKEKNGKEKEAPVPDWHVEAERLLKRTERLHRSCFLMATMLETRPTADPKVFTLVPGNLALRLAKMKKRLEEVDPGGFIREHLTPPPFDETVVMLESPHESQAKVRDLLAQMRHERSVSVLAFALKSGWIKPLQK